MCSIAVDVHDLACYEILSNNLPASVVNHVLAGSRELAVALDDFVDSIKKIFLGDTLSASSDSKHTSLCANRSDISTSRVGAETSNQLKSDVLVESHLLGVDLEDLHTALEIRESELDLAIKTTRSGKSGVKRIRSVGSHEHLDIATSLETIKLVHNFKHSSSNLIVTLTTTGAANSIDLIEEENARLFSAG